MAGVPSERMVLLHGDLELHIVEAQDLPNMDIASEHLRRCFTLCDTCRVPSSGRGDETGDHERKLHRHRRIITSDPYVTVCVPQATVARTRIFHNSQNPKWDQHYNIPMAHQLANLEFKVKDNDVFGAELIGTVLISAEKLAAGELISGWFPICAPSGKRPRPGAALRLEMKFMPCEKNPLYRNGIMADPHQLGVRHTYFPLRKGNSITLYQDAHISNNVKLPEFELDGRTIYQHSKCWEDICHAISEAHHMIYIVGWSIYHKVKLVREQTRPLPRGGDLTLGELLKYKSEEGVRVLLLVWDDKTSHSTFHTTGLMQTHDEETKKFFKHSSVICILSPRYASNKMSIIKQQVVGTLFTHHQKCVLVDTQAEGNNRKITAFLGGIDLCDGRYDSPDHRLFRDLDTVFQDDFHNPTFPAGTKAPRQPWHDLHCKIEGPAAYDVLLNFEQRWKKASKWREFRFLKKGMSRWKDDAMLKIERISWILSPTFSVAEDGNYTVIPEDNPSVHVSREDDPENWHVQIFRSIDSGSVRGFPKTFDVAQSQNLLVAKNVVIDRSIQTAYIQAIRSAQHFIYIENQYFLGSSYAWPSYNNAGADNLIPMELALKIASKIKANERFAVYVVMPMWPEGDPTSAPMQEILYWQGQTIQMMYEVVARELKAVQLVYSHPLEYLNFFCLGNREEMPSEVRRSAEGANKVSDSWKFQRFMIYVHAKGMIVDDEYVIIGSANINQRSMAGTKDTELAMGAYQPHHTWPQKQQHPRGQIYGYRMSLWAEHLEMREKCFEEPESLECVRRVNEVAEENWRRFTADTFTALQGHLLKYPIQVDADGKVGALAGYENFPDVGGKVLGAHSQTLPDTLTT